MRSRSFPLGILVATIVGCGAPPAPTAPPSGDDPPSPASSAVPVRPGVGLVERDGLARGEKGENACRVPLPAAAQVQLILEAPMAGLEVEAVGDDLTLLIRQGKSQWCGMVDRGAPRVARGAWSKGAYDVFVGTTERGGERPFKLRVLEPGR